MKVHIFHSFFASTLGLRPVLASQFYKNMMKNYEPICLDQAVNVIFL